MGKVTSKDLIYGKVTVEDAAIVELLKSPALQRLKNISQFGIPDKYYHVKNYSRYEHSVGVMLLLRRLGASLEEQIAGLLHDVSHLAFSHVADWVFAAGHKGNEDLQNTLLEKFVRHSKIASILTEHGLVVDRLIDEENYPLLEKAIPDLCADRVDYALREFRYRLNPKIVRDCLTGLVNHNGEIVFNDLKTAQLFAANFVALQTEHWGGVEAVSRYHLFSKALKLALKEGVIAKRDFYQDEPFVLAKLESDKSPKIKEILTLISQKELKGYRPVPGQKVFKKFRYVDPKVIVAGEPVRLSALDPKFAKLLDRHRKINEKGVIV